MSRVKHSSILLFLATCLLAGCRHADLGRPMGPALSVSENQRYLVAVGGEPFLWIGGTTWGMPEWLNREEIDTYLDHRKALGFTVVQVCLFWGKRVDDPVNFFVNPPNAYGFRAFHELNGLPDTLRPDVQPGGTADAPNDYWDHVDYIFQAARERGMFVGALPVWGRRYVNAFHGDFSYPAFSIESMHAYGVFLGQRFGHYENLIWVLGGDVQADANGDHRAWYRSMAEGLLKGVTGADIAWNETSELWDRLLMTYHPDGAPMANSSKWFHQDAWLDFNMIETYQSVDYIYRAVRQDYQLEQPVKPTVLAEPSYENQYKGYPLTSALQLRRQAYQSFFAGAAGFTYGAFRDADGNGPMFSPFKGWQNALDMEGALDMRHVHDFCRDNGWPAWTPDQDILIDLAGEGELQKVAVRSGSSDYLIYFPDNSAAVMHFPGRQGASTIKAKWFCPANGQYAPPSLLGLEDGHLRIAPPEGWEDAVLVLGGQ